MKVQILQLLAAHKNPWKKSKKRWEKEQGILIEGHRRNRRESGKEESVLAAVRAKAAGRAVWGSALGYAQGGGEHTAGGGGGRLEKRSVA